MTGQNGPRRSPRQQPGPGPRPRSKPRSQLKHLPRQPKQPPRPAEPASGPPAAQPAPRRVAVSAPRRHRTGGYSARAGAADLHAQPRLGQLYVRSLVRNQLRLSLGVLAVLAAVLGGLPVALALLPGLRTAGIAGIRLPWLLLGVVAYPLLVGGAYFHVRHAERVERDFADLLGGPDTTPAEPPRDAR